MYLKLHLTEWPFRTVPDDNFCKFFADRTNFKNDISVFLNNLSIQPASSLHLMWAWFGAGKTHSLKYLEHLCKTKHTNILPIYMEFPRSVTKFLDLYKLFINRQMIDFVDDIYSKMYGEDLQKELQLDYPDLSKALKHHVAGDDNEQDIAIRWLKAECKELKTLRSVGISKPVSTAEDAIKAISWIFKLIFEGSKYIINAKTRILWMIDEFQRVDECRTPTKNEINSCLVSIFNRCPNCLSIIISFSGFPEEKKLPKWLSKEVKDRVGVNPFFVLPPLSENEAYQFIKDVLFHFRMPAANVPNPFFPFCEDSIKRIVYLIKEKAKEANRKDQPKPRTVMQFCDIILKGAYPKLEKNEMDLIDANFVDETLKDISLPPE